MMGSPFSKRMISCQIIAVFFIIGFGCGTDPESKNVGSYRINVYSGNNQFAEPQEFLDAPVVFQITDKTGKPLSDLQVRLSIIIGGGSLDRNIDQTDQDGLVSVNWRIGADVDQIMKAEVTDGNDVNSTSWALANSSVHFNGNWVSGLVLSKIFLNPLNMITGLWKRIIF